MPLTLVLEKTWQLSICEIGLPGDLADHIVRIRLNTAGISGNDIRCCPRGRIGPIVVKEPMVLGDEVEGSVNLASANVYDLAIELFATGGTDLNPLISEAHPRLESLQAFEPVAEARPTHIKLQIEMPR